jgi:Na+-transporting NADH:ubiquinone oxidoreductase subunit B
VHGFWTTNRIIVSVTLALLPPLFEALHRVGVVLLPALGMALLSALGWQTLFSLCRGRALSASGVITAVAVVVMLPPAAPLWQIALAVSFGVVVGEQVFGGYGWNFLNPAALALAFLMFSFPAGGYDQGGLVGWSVCVPGAVLLAVSGIISWRVVIAAVAGAAATAYLADGAWAPQKFLEGGYVFGLVFLACDPVSAPTTGLGRWAYGLMIGSLFAVAGAGSEGSADDVVFACLIGGIFAPLIDQACIWLNVRRRNRRYAEAGP